MKSRGLWTRTKGLGDNKVLDGRLAIDATASGGRGARQGSTPFFRAAWRRVGLRTGHGVPLCPRSALGQGPSFRGAVASRVVRAKRLRMQAGHQKSTDRPR